MAPRLLCALALVPVTAAATDGVSHATSAHSKCHTLLAGLSDSSYSADELALLCRAHAPTELCRAEATELGAKPWSPASIGRVCSKWDSRDDEASRELQLLPGEMMMGHEDFQATTDNIMKDKSAATSEEEAAKYKKQLDDVNQQKVAMAKEIADSTKSDVEDAAEDTADKVAGDAMDAAKDATKDVDIAEAAGDAVDAVQDSVGNAADNARDAAGNTNDAVQDAVGDALDAAKDATKDVDIADAAGDAADAVQDAAGIAADNARDAAGNAKDAVQDAAGDVLGAAQDAANNVDVDNAAVQAADAAHDAAGDALDAAKHVSGGVEIVNGQWSGRDDATEQFELLSLRRGEASSTGTPQLALATAGSVAVLGVVGVAMVIFKYTMGRHEALSQTESDAELSQR